MNVKSVKLAVAWMVLSVTLALSSLAFFRSVTTVGKPFAGFFYSPNLLISLGQRSEWAGMKVGLRPMDALVAVNGHPITSHEDLSERITSTRPGEILTYQVERKGAIFTFKIPAGTIQLSDYIIVFLLPFLLGMLFIFFGTMLYFFDYAPRGRLLYLMICSMIGLLGTTSYEAQSSLFFYRILLVYPVTAALTVHLFSLFPESRTHKGFIRVLLYILYASSVALFLSKEYAVLWVDASILLSQLSCALVLMCITLSIYFLIDGYYQTVNQTTRDKIKVLGLGIFIMTLFLITWASSLLSNTKPFYLDGGLLLAAVFPIFMGYAIVRNNLFQLDRIIRQTLSSGASAMFVFAIYLIVFAGLRYLFPDEKFSSTFRWALVCFFFFLGFVFNYLRQKINLWLQRVLFSSQYNVQEALAGLDALLLSGEGVSAIAKNVGKKTVELFDVKKMYMVLFSRQFVSEHLLLSFNTEEVFEIEKHIPLFKTEGLIAEFERKPYPLQTKSIPYLRPDLFLQSMLHLRAHHIELVVPVVANKKLLALLLIGEKKSQDFFDSTDENFFLALAKKMGLVLENAELSFETNRQSRLAELGHMASILIHDIKNPLSTIRLSSGSLKKRFSSHDPSYELATFIEDEAKRMDQTVSQILTYAKPVGVRFEVCVLNELIDTLLLKMQPSFDQKNITCTFKKDGKNPAIRGDKNRLLRALENILLNAIEASLVNGVIQVETVFQKTPANRAGAAVVIQDFGHGMEPSLRDQIFKPFFTTKPQGTGLGLSIVDQIMQEHSATIDIQSRKNQGTTFTLIFDEVT